VYVITIVTVQYKPHANKVLKQHHGNYTLYVKSFEGGNFCGFCGFFANRECFIIEIFPWISALSTNYAKYGVTFSTTKVFHTY